MPATRSHQLLRLVVLIILVAGLVACGDESDTAATDAASEDVVSEPASDAASAAGGGTTANPTEGTEIRTDDAGVVVSDDLATKPTIELPGGEPPTELVAYDVVEGDGETAGPGATVETQYVGVCWSNGEQFDASWDGDGPISFGLDQVIPGWTEGIPGMKVGGRRLLVIPGELAYGDQSIPDTCIEPGETLVFAIDLIDTEG